MKQVTVKIVNKSKHPLPAYATDLAAGMDLRANIDTPIVLAPMERRLVPTGIHIQLPEGYECQIRPRSGLALNHGVTLVNAPGTVDADYTGDVGAIVQNLGNEPFTINDGERICQMVVKEYVRVVWNEVDTLDATKRGDGGFGHTGIE